MERRVAFQFRHCFGFEEKSHGFDKLAHRRLIHHDSDLSMDDEIDEIYFSFGGSPPDGSALDGTIVAKALIHAHAHHAPFERAINDPCPRLVCIDVIATRFLVTIQTIFEVAKAPDHFLRDTKAPGVRADPADIL